MAINNTYKTVTSTIDAAEKTIYTAPTGFTSIILLAQISNVTSNAGTVTFSHVQGSVKTELVKNYSIPGNDAASPISGKLILESGQKINVSANSNGVMKITLSILESSNE